MLKKLKNVISPWKTLSEQILKIVWKQLETYGFLIISGRIEADQFAYIHLILKERLGHDP